MIPFDRDLTTQVVTEEDTAQITACLQRLISDSGASCGMVIDRAGQMLAWESESARPELMHLGALLAATYASTQEMARLLNEDGFRTLFQEGLREKIFTETVQDQWLLAVIFDQHAQVGLVKVLSKRATTVLSNILDLVKHRTAMGASPKMHHFRKATADTIDLLFKDDTDEGKSDPSNE